MVYKSFNKKSSGGVISRLELEILASQDKYAIKSKIIPTDEHYYKNYENQLTENLKQQKAY